MSSPAEKSYEAIKAELDATVDIHPLGGGPVDEYLALKHSGQEAAAEAFRITTGAKLAADLSELRRQADEATGRTE